MEALGFLFPGLIQLLVVVGIIAAIVAVVRRRGGVGGEDEPGIGTLKRVYYYILAFVALMVAAVGVTNLVDYTGQRLFGPRVLTGGESQLALALALTLVGTPIWLLFWGLAQRAIRQFPAETQTLSRKLYMYIVLGVSAALTAAALVSLLRWLFGAEEFNGMHIAFPLVWGGLWAFHWRTETLEGQRAELGRSVRRLYVYVTSLYGLVMLTLGVGIILGQLLRRAYDALFATQMVTPPGVTLWSDAIQGTIGLALVGGLYWWWHWHRVALKDTDSVLRQVYLYLFAILGGALTVVVSLSILLFRVLQWLIGEQGGASTATHFQFLPGVIVAMTMGAGVWGYHWATTQQEAKAAPAGLMAARRVYRYLMAALGLATLSTGLVVLFSVVLGILVPESRQRLVDSGWWRNPFALAVTLMAVGTPVWRFFWFGAQRETRAGGAEERIALSRRVFIYLVFGIAVLVTLGNLSALLFMLFRDLLEGHLSAQVLQDAKWSIGMLLMAGTVSVYYWLVLQEDRRAMPPQEAAPGLRKTVTAIASEEAMPEVQRLEALLGLRFRLWRYLGADPGTPHLTDEDLSAVQERIAQAPGDRVLLTFDASGVTVVSYREG